MRPIDADVLKKAIYNDVPLKYFSGRNTGRALRNMEFILHAIDMMPTVDEATPVKHGHWVMKKSPIMPEVDECDQCGLSIPYCHGFKYCPHCGAKMDEKVVASNSEATTE